MNEPADSIGRETTLAVSAVKRIEDVCSQFEQACKSGNGAKIEHYVALAMQGERKHVLQALLQILVMYDDQAREAEYATRFPHDRDIVASVFRSHRPERFGPYRIVRKLGRGSWGIVYLAKDENLDRCVAIKVPREDRSLNKERFLDEARAAAKLSHPGIVSIYYAGIDKAKPFVAMEFIDGASLDKVMADGGLSHCESVRLVVGIASAVHYAHKHGLVHRDLKPANILIDQNGQPHVADFGLAVNELSQRTLRGDSSGTPAYRSPEQVLGKAHVMDGRSDVWSLGVMLYELLTTRRPFNGNSLRELNQEILERQPRPPRAIDDTIPESLEQVCLKSLSKRVENRYNTADSMANALRRAMFQQAKIDLVVEPVRSRGIEVESVQPPFYVGMHVRVRVRTNRDCCLWIVNIGSDGKVSTLIPNSHTTVNSVNANEWHEFPAVYDKYAFPLRGPAGTEKMIAVATDAPLSLRNCERIGVQDLAVGRELPGEQETPTLVVGMTMVQFCVDEAEKV